MWVLIKEAYGRGRGTNNVSEHGMYYLNLDNVLTMSVLKGKYNDGFYIEFEMAGAAEEMSVLKVSVSSAKVGFSIINHLVSFPSGHPSVAICGNKIYELGGEYGQELTEI